MQDSDFHDELDQIFEQIEDAIDALTDDLDVDSSNGVLNITFANGTSVIFSRQVVNHEIWVAAKSGGFHLHKQDDDWFCATTQEGLSEPCIYGADRPRYALVIGQISWF